MAKRYPNNKSIQMSFLFIEAREQITGLYYRAQKRDCPYRPVFFFVTRRRLCSADRASFCFGLQPQVRGAAPSNPVHT